MFELTHGRPQLFHLCLLVFDLVSKIRRQVAVANRTLDRSARKILLCLIDSELGFANLLKERLSGDTPDQMWQKPIDGAVYRSERTDFFHQCLYIGALFCIDRRGDVRLQHADDEHKADDPAAATRKIKHESDSRDCS